MSYKLACGARRHASCNAMWSRAQNTDQPRLIDVNRPSSEAVPNDPDSDFDDPPKALPPKKRARKAEGPRKHVPKAVPRIGACGWKNLDRTILEVRDAYPNSSVALCLLSESLEHHPAVQNSGCDSQFVAQTRDGRPFRLHPDEDELDEDEFMGLFASGPYDRADPGVCDVIIEHLDMGNYHYAIVVDASERGLNFARLAARVAMLKWARRARDGEVFASLLMGGDKFQLIPAPTDAKWKAALERVKRGRSWAEVRELARDWFVSL